MKQTTQTKLGNKKIYLIGLVDLFECEKRNKTQFQNAVGFINSNKDLFD